MAPSKPKSQSWKIEAGVAPLSGIGKQKSTMSPHQQRLLEALRKAQVQVERASFFGAPDPAVLAFIKEAERKLAAMEDRKNKPRRVSPKTGKVVQEAGVIHQQPVVLPAIPKDELAVLHEVAAALKADREAQTRTDVVEAMRIMSVAAMPRTRKEALKGTYHVIWPMASDRWCRASVTGDEGRETNWGKDRVWMRLIQTWIREALLNDPNVRRVAFPSYRSLLRRMRMAEGGSQIRQVEEAMKRTANCTWRFDFAASKKELEDLPRSPKGRDNKAIRFILITKFNLPSKAEVDMEVQGGTDPLQMGDGKDGEPYFLEFTDEVARVLLDRHELHILPMSLLQLIADEPLTMDFWDWVLQVAKRLTNPWEVGEDLLLGMFGKGRGKEGDGKHLTTDQRKQLFYELDRALARLIKAVAPQFHAEFRLEPLPRIPGRRGPTQTERKLVIYPLRGDIEYLRDPRKAALKG